MNDDMTILGAINQFGLHSFGGVNFHRVVGKNHLPKGSPLFDDGFRVHRETVLPSVFRGRRVLAQTDEIVDQNTLYATPPCDYGADKVYEGRINTTWITTNVI